jgi:hypothetical protein
VSLAHHALVPGKGFEHFVEADLDALAGVYPALKPNRLDSRTKSKKHAPVGLDELDVFIDEMVIAQDKILALIDRNR